uniref:Prepilin-type N-terminal cleavage/methylation domain-containing protein n=1 Tax=Thermodesulfobacterium geofontis TaxID=1295609 RepID=A0A7V6CDP0_9BACT
MQNLKSKGFTLVELAIVLVIIGIIIGAILKGQDLIQNARMKKFVNDAGRKWEVATWIFYDREGRFPGDANKDGIIGDGNVKTDLVDRSRLLLSGDNQITLGSFYFLVGLGNDGATRPKNVLVVCSGTTSCQQATEDEIEFFKTFDTSFDGVADVGTGLVRGYKTTTPDINATTWVATVASANIEGTTGNWTSGTHHALVYYFDRRP